MRPSLFSSCSEETHVRFSLARKVYAASVVFSTAMEEGARLVLTTSAGLRAGEKVLVVIDEGTRSVGEAFLAAAKGLGTDPALLEIRARTTDGEEPPEPVGTAMAAADLVLLATTYSLTHTHARRSANRAGARVISMPGIEEGMLRQGGLATDWAKIHEVVRRTARRLRGAREVHLTSAAGTDLSFSLEGRDWISEDTGLCTRKGTVTTLPAGELFIAVVEGSASGRLVVDVHFEERLRGPATAQIADGTASRIVGAQAAVDAMNRGGKDGRALGRFGFGLNPQARVMGPHLEAEKAVGSAHLGFGDNLVIGGKIHPGVRVECILSEVRVEVDSRAVIEKGRLVE
ncbi:MAG: aminopeptidase [Methanobacteriota archaeon]|nr:MAG: aminopeptidase [Euryarchaeota archaeon]